jgi:hypothetical protein
VDSTKGKKTLDNLVNEATAQISNKKYAEGVRKSHDVNSITCIAIGFKGKEVKINIA